MNTPLKRYTKLGGTLRVTLQVVCVQFTVSLAHTHRASWWWVAACWWIAGISHRFSKAQAKYKQSTERVKFSGWDGTKPHTIISKKSREHYGPAHIIVGA